MSISITTTTGSITVTDPTQVVTSVSLPSKINVTPTRPRILIEVTNSVNALR
jgi:hypothetical protein|tara:strand:- start:321 stop:476 length:156 start_codon:yes stop_codon:yes gene_type:complete